MTLLTSIFHRQLVPSPLKRSFPVDFALETFNCVKEDEHLVQRREIFVPPFACGFSKAGFGGHMLGIADEDGWVQILDSRKTGSKSVIKEWNAHENAVFDIAWMEGQEMLVTASGDQTVRMWDVSRDECLAVFKGHSCSVKSVDFREDDIFIFATGARDGNVMVWDMRCNRRTGRFCQPVNVISNAHTEKVPGTPQTTKKKPRRASTTTARPVMNSGQQSVTAVLFQGSEKLISTGAMDGKIKIWDLRKTYTNLKHDPVPFHTFPYPGQGVRKHGFSSLVLDSTHSRLFASCTNDNIYMYSCTALGQEPICAFTGHLNSTFYVKTALSPDDIYLLSGSGDNDAYIWKVSDPAAPPFVLKGHTGEVTSVTWCPSDQGKVVTCSDDNTFRIWRMDCQVCKSDKLNVIGESYRATSLKSNSPLNDKTNQSRHGRTPSHSPSISPHPKRILWTLPTKVITNPRLHQISSPVGMVPFNPQSPLNKTPPKMQSISSLSPVVSASPKNLQTGLSTQLAPNKLPYPSPARTSVSLPLSPRGELSEGSKTSSAADAKFQSPKQLLTSWLRTNSRKRTHSDSNNKTTPDSNSLTSEPSSDSTVKFKNSSHNVDQQSHILRNNQTEHRTNNTKENGSNGENSPSESPLKKRLCVNTSLNLSSHVQESKHEKLKPGKENSTCDHTYCLPVEEKKSDAKCKETSITTSKQNIPTQSECEPSTPASTQNWLIERSIYCKAKYRHKNSSLPGHGGESTATETLTAKGSSADDVQILSVQKEDQPKPGQSILTYFKPVSPS